MRWETRFGTSAGLHTDSQYRPDPLQPGCSCRLGNGGYTRVCVCGSGSKEAMDALEAEARLLGVDPVPHRGKPEGHLRAVVDCARADAARRQSAAHRPSPSEIVAAQDRAAFEKARGDTAEVRSDAAERPARRLSPTELLQKQARDAFTAARGGR